MRRVPTQSPFPNIGDRIEVIDPSWQAARQGELGTVVAIKPSSVRRDYTCFVEWDNTIGQTDHNMDWFDGGFYKIIEQQRIDWSEYLELQ